VGYSRRGTALFIDSIWWTLLALLVPVEPDISLDNPASLLTLFSWSTLAWMLFAQCLPALITGVLWATWGTSPGKRLLGLHIVDAETGLPMSLRQDLLRTLGYLSCFASMGLGFLPLLVSRRKQGLHDLMANTVVVETLPMRPSFQASKGRNRACP
jgi:uncharacterized RDD family membrane protein YckC